MTRFAILALVIAALAPLALADAPATQPATAPSTAPAAIDLGNTVCPISDEKVGDSTLTEVYEGKIYHFCCPGCPDDFKKDPAKYAKLVANNPEKYGVKK